MTEKILKIIIFILCQSLITLGLFIPTCYNLFILLTSNKETEFIITCLIEIIHILICYILLTLYMLDIKLDIQQLTIELFQSWYKLSLFIWTIVNILSVFIAPSIKNYNYQSFVFGFLVVMRIGINLACIVLLKRLDIIKNTNRIHIMPIV